MERRHAPFQLLQESKDAIALVILNQPLPQHAFPELWKRAAVRVCADGGANRLFDECKQRERFIPDAIIGDLDSLRPDVRKFYETHGSKVIHVEDQDSTDLGKSMRYVLDNAPKHEGFIELSAVFILSSVMTRFDHAMANIHSLYEFQDRVPDIYLIGAESCIWLLNKGEHRIFVSETEGPSCGLLPIGGPCKRVTTTGLRWNLNKTELAFGNLVSSSNTYLPAGKGDRVVTINTDAPLVWTTEYDPKRLASAIAESGSPVPHSHSL